MENVVLIILLILALSLIVVVLLQRSEGGGLGMGGGGGGGVMSGRAAATALSKLTWILGIAFMVASLAMTVISSNKSSGSSIFDTPVPPSEASTDTPAIPFEGNIVPPSENDNAPLIPRAE